MAYLEDMYGYSGKTVAISGGGGVLAGAIAEAFLNAGANVSLWGPHPESLSKAVELLESIRGGKDRVTFEIADASREPDVENALQSTLTRYGSLDVLVNGVGGVGKKCTFLEIDIDQFREVIDLNLIAGLVIPTKVICRHWTAGKFKGAIVNIGSMGSYVPLSGVWAYDSAKAGVLNLTMATAKEFAQHGIRVNAIAPGFFLGKQNRALLMDEKTGELTKRGKDVISRTPCRKFGEPRDVAGAVLFLASEKAAGYVTGACIPVDGGFLVDCI